MRFERIFPLAKIAFVVFGSMFFMVLGSIANTPVIQAEEKSMKDGIPWQEIGSLEQLESHLEQQAKSLGSKDRIRVYLENSGFTVSFIPVGLSVMRIHGFEELGVSVQGTRDPREIDGPLGRWWRRTLAHGLFASITLTESGKLVDVQALYNYE